MVLIAGLIFSSFPHESIKRSPPHRINIIESIHAVKTKRDIRRRKKSQKVRFSENIPPNLHISLSKFPFILQLKFDVEPIVPFVPKSAVLPFGLKSPGEAELLIAII